MRSDILLIQLFQFIMQGVKLSILLRYYGKKLFKMLVDDSRFLQVWINRIRIFLVKLQKGKLTLLHNALAQEILPFHHRSTDTDCIHGLPTVIGSKCISRYTVQRLSYDPEHTCPWKTCLLHAGQLTRSLGHTSWCFYIIYIQWCSCMFVLIFLFYLKIDADRAIPEASKFARHN